MTLSLGAGTTRITKPGGGPLCKKNKTLQLCSYEGRPRAAILCWAVRIRSVTGRKNIQRKKYDKLISSGNAGVSVTNVDRIPERCKQLYPNELVRACRETITWVSISFTRVVCGKMTAPGPETNEFLECSYADKMIICCLCCSTAFCCAHWPWRRRK